MASIEDLQKKIKELEQELKEERSKGGAIRTKISQMSSEVVDSNPYRYMKWFFISIYFCIPISSFNSFVQSLLNVWFEPLFSYHMGNPSKLYFVHMAIWFCCQKFYYLRKYSLIIQNDSMFFISVAWWHWNVWGLWIIMR